MCPLYYVRHITADALKETLALPSIVDTVTFRQTAMNNLNQSQLSDLCVLINVTNTEVLNVLETIIKFIIIMFCTVPTFKTIKSFIHSFKALFICYVKTLGNNFV